jgi:cytochrome P450
LLKQPLLQAVYAETLRLRGHGCFVRVAQHDTRLNGWLIPKGSFTVASSTPGHMDPNIWCRSGTDAPPVDVFWPGRFLKINGDLIEFCTRDVEGSWMPYGSGWNMCPGRHFAKLQAILTVAHLVSAFDCERVGDDRVGMSMANFGIGILGPDRKVPVRMRRRAVANM